MVQMPDVANLIMEMTAILPLHCTSKKRNTQTLAAQGLHLNGKTRLEVTDVRDMGEFRDVSCIIDNCL
jgi:hypothetical protein